MNRILDFQYEEAADVVNRVVMQVHKAIDENFPQVANTSKRFAKTAFAHEDTVIERFNNPDTAEKSSQTVSEASPRPVDAPSDVARPTPAPEQPLSDMRAVTPMSAPPAVEFSAVDTLEKTRHNKPSLLKRVLVLIGITLVLSALFALWIHKTLVW